MATFPDVKALTFDIYGTVLDLTGSLAPIIDDFLKAKGATVSTAQFWGDWRARQRLEQFQDTIMMVGHYAYVAKPVQVENHDKRIAGLLTLRRTQLSASGSRDDHETIAKLIQLHQQKTFWRWTSNSSESVNIEPGSRCSHN